MNTMYNGLKLLQMAQVIKDSGWDMPRLCDIAKALLDYRKRAGPLNFQLEKADFFFRELELALEGEGTSSTEISSEEEREEIDPNWPDRDMLGTFDEPA